MSPAAAAVPPDFTRRGALIGDKYRVEGVLGRGGMGVVLRATHLDLDQEVAIKVIRSELASDDVVVERMLVEARSAAQIRSEHVARVLDVSRLEDGTPYLVMEYLEGEDLASELERRGRLPASEAVDIVVQACHALAEAHWAGIVHRDLKPENLFLASRPDGTEIVKVLDFGISKRFSGTPSRRSLTQTGMLIGSPHYMAPEQLEASDELDGRADVWALGVILFEMVMGRPPFDGDVVQDICMSVLTRPPPPLDGALPPEVSGAITRCLEKARERRFEGVAELALAIAPAGGPEAARIADRAARVAAGRRATPPDSLGSPSSVRPVVPIAPVDSPPSLDAVVRDPHRRDTRIVSRTGRRWRSVAVLAMSATVLAFGVTRVTGALDERPDRPPGSPRPAAKPTSAPTATIPAPGERGPRRAGEGRVTTTDSPEPPTSGQPSRLAAPGKDDPRAEAESPKRATARRRKVHPAQKPRRRSKAEAATPTPAAPPTAADVSGPRDAWDPSTFGGRK